MNNDLISREALKEEVSKLILNWNDKTEYGQARISSYEFVLDLIDNAPTVDPIERIGAICNENCGYNPQGDIRWTDKLSVTNSGDIIDFEGRVVGHINLEDVKGGADNEID